MVSDSVGSVVVVLVVCSSGAKRESILVNSLHPSLSLPHFMSCPFIFLMMMITLHPYSFFKIYHQQDYMTGSTNGSKPTKRNKIRNELNFCWCGSGTISENIQNSQNWIKQKIENEQKQEWREILLLEQRHWHNIPELQVGSNPDSAKLGFYKILQQGQSFASGGGWAHVN